MGLGYCKACRSHEVEVHYLDRDKNNYIIRGQYARTGNKQDEYESSGVCARCEQQTLVTPDELLRASYLWGKHAVHDMIAINEYLNSLDRTELYDAGKLVFGAPVALQANPDTRASLEGLVMASARVRMSNGSPRDMKQAAESVFIPHYESWSRISSSAEKRLESFDDKWRFF